MNKNPQSLKKIVISFYQVSSPVWLFKCINNSLMVQVIYVFILDALTNDKNADRQLIKLRHPQTSELAIFVYSENDKTLAQMRSLPFSHRYI